MRIFLLLLITQLCSLSINSASLAKPTVKGSGKISSKEISIASYNSIEIVDKCDLVYEQKTKESPYLRIEIDDNLQDKLDVKVVNHILSISFIDGKHKPTKYKVYTNSLALANVKLTGSGNINLKGSIKSADLNISIIGSGLIKADKLSCSNLVVSVSGSGNAVLKGEASQNEVKLSGTGNIDTSGLKAKEVNCKSSGSGNIKVYASESLYIRTTGKGSVSYKGSPAKVDQKASGSGKVKHL